MQLKKTKILQKLFLISFLALTAYAIFFIYNTLTNHKIYDYGYISLGGYKQYYSAKSVNKANPVLLILHGGPGISSFGLFREYNNGMQDDYIVVHWDQLGTGRSYSPLIQPMDMTFERLIDDAHQLTAFLKKKYNKDNIYLMGHSWGTTLGLELIRKYPEDYIAFIAVGTNVNLFQSLNLGKKQLINIAKNSNNSAAISALKNMPDLGSLKTLKQQANYSAELRKWSDRLSKSNLKISDVERMKVTAARNNPEYSKQDIDNIKFGSMFSFSALQDDVIYTNQLEKPLNFSISLYFIQGKFDFITNTSLVKTYFNKIKAPEKKLYIFNKSGHYPFIEEPNKFNRIMKEIKNFE